MNYKKARNRAWQVLARCKVSSLPVNVGEICRREGIRLITYQEGAELIERLQLQEHTRENDAFSLKGLIFYDDTKPEARKRFSVAHELGHALLHDGGGAGVHDRKAVPTNDPLESEANVFASRLLAPLCVLEALNVQSAAEIAALCHISMTAAEIRFARLQEIRVRDRRFHCLFGHGCFLTSCYERRVLRRFDRFIKENRRG